mgnify:CR=1 FL=1
MKKYNSEMKKIFLFTVLFCALCAQLSGAIEAPKDENNASTDPIEQAKALIMQGKIEESYALLHKTANSGDATAMLAVGNMYFEGKGVKQDYKEAIKWLKKAIRAGNANAWHLHFLLKKAIRAGNAGAKHLLAKAYKDGLGVEQSYHRAFNLYLQSALESSDKKSMFYVSAMYYHGQGTQRDFDKAYNWAFQAAEKREPRAAFLTALMIYRGEAKEKDIEKAFEYAQMSHSLGNTEAMKLITLIQDKYAKQQAEANASKTTLEMK